MLRDASDRPRDLIFVVDDDSSVRRALTRVLCSAGFEARAFACAADVLAHDAAESPACVVLDVCMPGIDGLELQARWCATGRDPAIVFLSGRGDVRIATGAMKAGAVDFLEKPIDADTLVATVRRAVARDAEARRTRDTHDELATREAWLTRRERQVMALVVDGLPNKLIAAELGTSEKTVKVHRARVMTKMAARSLPDLVRMSLALGSAPRR